LGKIAAVAVEVDIIMFLVAAERPVVFILAIAAARFRSSTQPPCGATIATKTAVSNRPAAGCSKNASVEEAAMTALRHIQIVAAAAKQPIVAVGARREAAGEVHGAVRLADLDVVYFPVALIATVVPPVIPTPATT
jgi:hypothetical protein